MRKLLTLIVLLISIFAIVSYALSGTVYLANPINNIFTNQKNNTLEFIFYYQGDNSPASCTLYVDSIASATNDSTINNTNTTLFSNQSFTEIQHSWDISCTNNTTITSETWYFTADYTLPFINVTYPEESQSISGDVSFNTSANDTSNISSFLWSSNCGSNVSESQTCSGNYCNHTVVIDTTTVTNGFCQYSISANDTAGNYNATMRSVYVNNSQPAPPTNPQTGGFFFIMQPKTFLLNFIENDSITLVMKEWGRAIYYFDNVNHTITIEHLEKNYIDILIQSEPIKISLNISEVVLVDINSDGVYDLAIVLNGIENDIANITFKKLEVVTRINETKNITETTPTGLFLISDAFNLAILFIIAGIILLLFKKNQISLPLKKISTTPKVNNNLLTVMNGLIDREKMIVKYLMKRGEVRQSILSKELGISKASLSRWLRNLELKGIVETKKFGKMKKINISKRYK